ncbi:MAG: prepilin-type N-terminal cleavage/methylation domain-containing protein [Burkholderiales bacterium]|nr:prepilin-type N-terminal cleavage/methylation domain-containing protein [Burkholderiales bacterium]
MNRKRIINSKKTNRKKTDGFTLVEILTVLVILSLAVGLVTFNLTRDERRELEREARRLTGAIEYATERARYHHELLGLAALPEGKGWQFLQLPENSDTRWLVIDDDAPLAARKLPDHLRFYPQSYAGKEIDVHAVLPILPSGRFEPYQFELRNEGWRIRFIVDPLGRITTSLAETS